MIKIYNTLTKSKEEFRPIKEGEVGIYSCGPTVYNFVHIGNLRAYLVADLLHRAFLYNGYRVRHVMNITDVDDKTIRDSKAAGLSLKEFTEKYTQAFFEDLKKLNINTEEYVYPRATENIEGMVDLIKKLLDKGVAYRADDGSIYFAISKFTDYGKLSGVDFERDGKSRISNDEYAKDEAHDFALWKAWDEKDGDVFWDTELGKGRPGWHIECSVMSSVNLGETFDIHTGGIDLVFPHHENEIAQSEAANDKKFVNYWVHNEFLELDPLLGVKMINTTNICSICRFPNLIASERDYIRQKNDEGISLMVKCQNCGNVFFGGINIKMSKSKGNAITLDRLVETGYDPIAFRYLCLFTHYRQKQVFSYESLDSAKNGLKNLKRTISIIGELVEKGVERDDIEVDKNYKDKFMQAINDDINISKALAVLQELLADNNVKNPDKLATVLDFDKVLGLGLDKIEEEIIPQDVADLANQRQEAKNQKDFAKADEIRGKIEEMGYEVEDTKDGPKIKKKS